MEIIHLMVIKWLINKSNNLTNSFIHHPFSCGFQLEHRVSFGVSVITHTIRHKGGLLWMSDQPVAEICTYTGLHNIQTQKKNIHALSGFRTCDLSKQAAANLRLRPCGHRDRQFAKWKNVINVYDKHFNVF
jgi:hypothetical protein